MRYLPVVETAAQQHDLALAAALHGQFEQAEFHFEAAHGILADHAFDTAVTVQAARIARDRGFTFVRAALGVDASKEERTQRFHEAEMHLQSSAGATLELAGGFKKPFAGGIKNFLSKRQRREVISEHAITIGLLGEMVVAQQVALAEISEDKRASPEARAEQFQIALGYDLAKVGANQYYAARLARIGMRTERLNGGRLLNALPWLGRLTMSVARAAVHDRDNLPQAIAQFEKVRREALSRKAALTATRHWRTV